jgi:hypothetical protein
MRRPGQRDDRRRVGFRNDIAAGTGGSQILPNPSGNLVELSSAGAALSYREAAGSETASSHQPAQTPPTRHARLHCDRARLLSC